MKNSLLIIQKYNPGEYGKFYGYMFPINYGYIISAIKKAGHGVRCLNLNHCDGVKNPIAAALDATDFDYVLFGGDTRSFSAIAFMISEVRKHRSDPQIVVGGSIITTEPELIVNHLDVDFGIIGEGEDTIVELFDGKNPSKIRGLIYKRDSGIHLNEARSVVENLDTIPFPDYEEMGFREFLDNMKPSDSYFYSVVDYPRHYFLVGSRSCPFHCTFCWNYGKYRQRSINNILEEMTYAIEKYQINLFYLVDECVAIEEGRLIELCQGIIELRKEVRWDIKWICTIRVDFLTSELLVLLKRSGCWMVSYGFESYSTDILKSMKKRITPEQIKKAVHETMKAKLAIQAAFILGDPAETVETYKTTLHFYVNECQGQLQLRMVRPYPNSEVYQHCIKKGIIRNKLDFIKGVIDMDFNFVNMSDSMSDKEFWQMKKDILQTIAREGRVVVPRLIKERDTYNLQVTCPFCGYTYTYKNHKIKNRFLYNFTAHCRDCGKRYYIASRFSKILLNNFDKTMWLRDQKNKLLKKVTVIKIRWQ